MPRANSKIAQCNEKLKKHSISFYLFTCEAALLVALQNRRLVGSLLQQYNFPAVRTSLSYRQSLLYPPVLTVIPGQFVILHKFVPNCLRF